MKVRVVISKATSVEFDAPDKLSMAELKEYVAALNKNVDWVGKMYDIGPITIDGKLVAE